MYSIDKFGIDRCMFGSNFPVDKFLSPSMYTDYWNSYYNIVKDFSSNEKNKLFYINAEKYYKIWLKLFMLNIEFVFFLC